MRLLVLGGTHHVGRAVVEAALERGDEVTTINRGQSGVADPRAEARIADRLDEDSMRAAIGNDSWDAVIDTWSFAPIAVRDSVRLLERHVGHYGYVSSRSVYAWPMPSGADEHAPVVAADPDSDQTEDYAAAKRGGELAAEAFEGPVLLARAGLILGPYEIVGRMPWWLRRIAAGGPVPAPGPPDRPLQYVDARDLAVWMLRCADDGVGGAFNAVSEPGHTTIGELLTTCVEVTGSDAELVWCSPEQIDAAGVQGWTDLPVWTPPTGELAALHDANTAAAAAAGLVCRPIGATVAATWAWLQHEGFPDATSGRAGTLGISAEQERELLAGG